MEERLAEQARKYPHLYNASLPFYKTIQLTSSAYVRTSSVTRTLSTGDGLPKYKCSSLSDTFLFSSATFSKVSAT